MSSQAHYPPKLVDKIADLYLAGIKVIDIAAQLGVARSSVDYWARKRGLPRRHRHSGIYPQRAIVAAYEHGESATSLGRRFGRKDPGTILAILRANGVKVHGRNDRRKMTKVAECVRLYRQGWFHREIGKLLGLTRRQVELRVASVLGRNPGDGGRRRGARQTNGRPAPLVVSA